MTLQKLFDKYREDNPQEPMRVDVLADRLGVVRQTLKKWMTGELKPSKARLTQFAELTGKSLATINRAAAATARERSREVES